MSTRAEGGQEHLLALKIRGLKNYLNPIGKAPFGKIKFSDLFFCANLAFLRSPGNQRPIRNRIFIGINRFPADLLKQA
ncbi:hypothetical protein ES703_70335 [subsurface metagenome]